MKTVLRGAVVSLIGLSVLADGPADNLADNVRPVPPPGIQIPADVRTELEQGAARLRQELDALQASTNAMVAEFFPEVAIFHKAVDWAIRYNEIFSTNEIRSARNAIVKGLERAAELREGKPSWTTATGLVVRAYVSKIDGSIQPYGLVVPPSYRPNSGAKHRLDTWFHGRDEKLSELNFLTARQRSPGEFVPPDTFVLHLYGRFCNANKLAGEIDCLEALEHAQNYYPIDENRLVTRGFSMGGAACWQFAVHYPSLWAAAAPGAGFSETAQFLRVFQNENVQPPAYEQALWHVYDCTDYAGNLFNLPTVAYSGEIDRQKQAADVMAEALSAEGIELTHIIGPKTAHKYEEGAKREINRRIDAIAAVGRDPLPREVRFTTWTLRYNKSFWVTVDGLEKHWARARVNAKILEGSTVEVTTTNVTHLRLEMPSGLAPISGEPQILIDGKALKGPRVKSDRSWAATLVKGSGGWAVHRSPDSNALRKRPGLQGPIDDAFMDSFVFVKPTGKALNEQTAAWTQKEFDHAVKHWRQQFRGDARVVNDTEVTEELVQKHNVVLWGDPSSNRLLSEIMPKLPAQWTKETLKIGDHESPASSNVLAMIYPNPKNPTRYVVLNSSFTFREYDYLNNARQVPKLPDYAVINTSAPMTSRAPGKIEAAGFFNEQWQVP